MFGNCLHVCQCVSDGVRNNTRVNIKMIKDFRVQESFGAFSKCDDVKFSGGSHFTRHVVLINLRLL